MTREDAFFQMLLVRSGITEEYDAWFDRYLEEEERRMEEEMYDNEEQMTL